jgi:hypothetical protein
VRVADPSLLLVQPFTIVHDAANRRLAVRCDLDKVQTGFLGFADSLVSGDNTDLIVFLIDQPNLVGPDPPIDTQTSFHLS